jgi:O-antigen ligase
MVTLIAFFTLGLFMIGFFVFCTDAQARRLLPALLPSACAVLGGTALIMLGQFFLFPQTLNHGQPSWPFANPNNSAALLMLGLFPALGTALAAEGKKLRAGATIVAIILALGISITSSRGVTCLTLAGFAALGFLCRGRLRGPGRVFWLAFLALAAGILIQFALPGDGGAVPQIVAKAAKLTTADDSISSRLALWRATLDMIKDRPLLGSGYGTYYLMYPHYRLLSDPVSGGLEAHNDLLQLWSEMGVFAVVLLLLFYAGTVLRMGRVMRAHGPGAPARALCSGLFLGAALVGLDSTINFDLYAAAILCLLGLVTGLFFHYSGDAGDPPLSAQAISLRLPEKSPASAAWAVAVIPFIALVFAAQGFLRSEYYADSAEHAVSAGDMAAFQYNVDAARAASFDWSARPYLLAATIPLGIMQARGAALAPQERDSLAAQARSLLDRAAARNPRLVLIAYDRAIVARYAPEKDGKDSAAWLREALELNPGYFPARVDLAKLLLKSGEDGKALDVLAAGLGRPPTGGDFREYYTMTASLAVKQAKPETSAQALRELQIWTRRLRKAQKLPAG